MNGDNVNIEVKSPENILGQNLQISVQSLACVDLQTIQHCFNASFKNYYTPVQLDKHQIAEKLITEAIDLKLSFGIFNGDELIGFMLNGIDMAGNQKVAYMAASGILPEYRGYKLFYQLQEHSIQELKKAAVNKVVLEVIEQNTAAIKIYERFNFVVNRKLNSYAGKLILHDLQPVEIEVLPTPDWELIRKNCEWKPSWQFGTNCIKRAQSTYKLLVAYSNKLAVAYCISNFDTGTVAHFGCCELEHKEIYLSALFNKIKEISNTQNISVVNVDTNACYANTFLLSIGLSRLFTSCEMELVL